MSKDWGGFSGGIRQSQAEPNVPRLNARQEDRIEKSLTITNSNY